MSTLRPPAAGDAGVPAHPASPYAEALSAADGDLDEALAAIRAETAAGRLSVADAAGERAGLLERHLKHLEQLRLEHFGRTS